MRSPDPAGSSEETAAGDEQGPGVFGSLPRTRPSVRSPRRTEAPTEPAPAEAEASGGEDESAPASREAEVEALARAGISLAGDAATLGLRIAGRAAGALRGALERR
jgi:hypothetical protein